MTEDTLYISPAPLSLRGKTMLFITIVGIVSIWLLAIHAYFSLPQRIPTHFGPDGKPDSYGDKSMFLVLPAIFCIVPVIFILITKYRFVLINKYPYLVNLPAFFSRISEIKEDSRSYWVNKYFEAVLFLGTVLTFYMLLLEAGIYIGALYRALPWWFTPLALLSPIVLLLIFLVYMRGMSRSMMEEFAA